MNDEMVNLAIRYASTTIGLLEKENQRLSLENDLLKEQISRMQVRRNDSQWTPEELSRISRIVPENPTVTDDINKIHGGKI